MICAKLRVSTLRSFSRKSILILLSFKEMDSVFHTNPTASSSFMVTSEKTCPKCVGSWSSVSKSLSNGNCMCSYRSTCCTQVRWESERGFHSLAKDSFMALERALPPVALFTQKQPLQGKPAQPRRTGKHPGRAVWFRVHNIPVPNARALHIVTDAESPRLLALQEYPPWPDTPGSAVCYCREHGLKLPF